MRDAIARRPAISIQDRLEVGNLTVDEVCALKQRSRTRSFSPDLKAGLVQICKQGRERRAWSSRRAALHQRRSMRKRAAQTNFKKRPAVRRALRKPTCSFAAGHLKRSLSAMAVSAHDNVCKSHDALCAIWFDGAIRIEHAVTDDLPDGRPTVPLGDDDSPWTRVAPLPDGRTRWRRIHLQPNTALPIGVADEP